MTPSGTATVLELSGCEVAQAITEWLKRRAREVHGPRTIRLLRPKPGLATGGAKVFVDPEGHVEGMYHPPA